MAAMNRCEAEVDAIRDILHEKTKNMTAEEHTRWSNERAQRLAAQYNFKIAKPLKGAFIYEMYCYISMGRRSESVVYSIERDTRLNTGI